MDNGYGGDGDYGLRNGMELSAAMNGCDRRPGNGNGDGVRYGADYDSCGYDGDCGLDMVTVWWRLPVDAVWSWIPVMDMER